MRKGLLSLIISLLFSFPTQANPRENNGENLIWTFSNKFDDTTVPINVGTSLMDQIEGTSECCSGTYASAIPTSRLLQDAMFDIPAIYIPAIGGSVAVRVNGNSIKLPQRDFSSVGPVIPIHKSLLMEEVVKLEIEVKGPPTNLSGIWKQAPMFGEYSSLQDKRDLDYLFQQVVPAINALILALLASMFIVIHLSLRGKDSSYIIFAGALLSWALFYLFLSGYPRGWNYHLASALHYPVRILASIGLFAMAGRYFYKDMRQMRKWIYLFAACATANFALGMLGLPIHQKAMLLFTGVASFAPLIGFNWTGASRLQKTAFILSLVALSGQTSDAIALMKGNLEIPYPIPFLNRFTFLPILALSFGDCVVQFSKSFHDLRKNLFRVKGYAKISLDLARHEMTEADVEKFLRFPKRLTRVYRVSFIKRIDNQTYEVIQVDGVNPEAIGSKVNISDLPHFANSINRGEITFADLHERRGLEWKTRRCAAVPIPQIPNPPYALLLSDPMDPSLLSELDKPFLSQFSSALWASIEKTRETKSREAAERKFTDLVQMLDPNLYEFIARNPEVGATSEAPTQERGIIFFDQKSYTTFIEQLEEKDAARYAGLISVWVAEAAGRFGARVTDFIGDAYMLELFKLTSESNEALATRTVDLVWALSDSLPKLNQNLLKNGFSGITFRFGAHMGNVSTIPLDFIKPGLKSSVGDNVNIAARLQANAPAGRILVSESLAGILQDKYVFKLFPKAFVKGRKGILASYEVVGKINEMAS